MNSGYNVYGEGNRANSTIGRAVRLVMRNIGQLDRSTNGWPGRAMCLAENEERNPWTTYAEDKGYSRDTNTVTAFSVGGFVNLGDHHSTTGLGLLQAFLPRAREWRRRPVRAPSRDLAVSRICRTAC